MFEWLTNGATNCCQDLRIRFSATQSHLSAQRFNAGTALAGSTVQQMASTSTSSTSVPEITLVTTIPQMITSGYSFFASDVNAKERIIHGFQCGTSVARAGVATAQIFYPEIAILLTVANYLLVIYNAILLVGWSTSEYATTTTAEDVPAANAALAP